MLKYTVAAWHKIIDDLKRLFFIFNLVSLGFFTVYAVYYLITERGVVAVNIAIALISVAYMVYSVFTYLNAEKADKKQGKWANRIYKWSKISVNALSLAYMIYTVYYLAGNITLTSLMLTAFSAISWVLQVVLQLSLQFVEARGELLIDGIEADFEKVIDFKRGVGNIIKRVRGEEIEEKEELISPKNREILERQAEKDKLKKEEEKERKRLFRIRRKRGENEQNTEKEYSTK